MDRQKNDLLPQYLIFPLSFSLLSLIFVILISRFSLKPSALAAPDCSGCECGCECSWEGGFCDWYCLPCPPPEPGPEPGPGPCFAGETMIAGEDGAEKEIQTLEVGDTVRSFDYRSGEIDVSEVVSLHKREVREYFILRTDSGREVKVTEDHPFWAEKILEDRCLVDFVKVKDLESGDISFSLGRECGGSTEECLLGERIVEKALIREPVEVYNLTVDNDNTYFANDFAVHNKGHDSDAYFYLDSNMTGYHDDEANEPVFSSGDFYATFTGPYYDEFDEEHKCPTSEYNPLVGSGSGYCGDIFGNTVKAAYDEIISEGLGPIYAIPQTKRGSDYVVGGVRFKDDDGSPRPVYKYGKIWRYYYPTSITTSNIDIVGDTPEYRISPYSNGSELLGYIFPANQPQPPGTEPLYRLLYHAGTIRHVTVLGYETMQDLVSKSGYQPDYTKLLGYAYSNQQSGTVPIYRVFSNYRCDWATVSEGQKEYFQTEDYLRYSGSETLTAYVYSGKREDIGATRMLVRHFWSRADTRDRCEGPEDWDFADVVFDSMSHGSSWADFKPEKDYEGEGSESIHTGNFVQAAEFTVDYDGGYYLNVIKGNSNVAIFEKTGDFFTPSPFRIYEDRFGVFDNENNIGPYLGGATTPVCTLEGGNKNCVPISCSLSKDKEYIMALVFSSDDHYDESGFYFLWWHGGQEKTGGWYGDNDTSAIPVSGAGSALGTLQGRVWNDKDVSCSDELEDGIANATLYLDVWGGDSQLSIGGEASTFNYDFGEVSIGTHRVYIEPPSGYVIPPKCLANYMRDADGHYYLEVEVPAGGKGVANFGLFNVGVLGCVSKTMQAYGSGIMQQPAAMKFSVPNVSKARLYWSYRTRNEVEDGVASFENTSIPFSGEIAGRMLGTPTDTKLTAYSYGANILPYILPLPSVNDVLISDIYNESGFLAEGSGIIVISKTLPDQLQTIQLHEANDYFHWSFNNPDDRSDVYNFDLCAGAGDQAACTQALTFSRDVRLTLMVAGRDPDRPRASKVWLWSGLVPLGEGEDVIGHPGTVIVSEDPLYGGVGYNGDSFNTMIWRSGEGGLTLIPQAHRYVSLQVESPDPDSHPEGWSGESMTVVAAGLETSCIPGQPVPSYERPSSQSIPDPIMPMCADVTRSGLVDLDDTKVIVGEQNFNFSDCNNDVCQGDVNNDGVVNAFDFSLSVTQQGTGCGG